MFLVYVIHANQSFFHRVGLKCLSFKWAIFQLYHGENKLHVNEMMMIMRHTLI